jgi:zinc/manganese transport system ATP-binding protein
LSVGQFRRVLFARLLLQDAAVIVLDEPFAAIDAKTTDDLLALLDRWHAHGRTIVAVLHDFDQVRAHFPETLLIARDLIAWGDTASVMSAENLARARAMSEHWDDAPVFCDASHRHVA